MSVDGGFTTCWMVRSGVVDCAVDSFNRSGKQASKAGVPPPGTAASGEAAAAAVGRATARPAALAAVRQRHALGRQALPERLALGVGQRLWALRLRVGLATGLDGRHDLGHGAGLVLRELH